MREFEQLNINAFFTWFLAIAFNGNHREIFLTIKY